MRTDFIAPNYNKNNLGFLIDFDYFFILDMEMLHLSFNVLYKHLEQSPKLLIHVNNIVTKYK